MKLKLILYTGTLFLCQYFYAQKLKNQTTHVIGRPDSHAPIHVMGDHLHKKGEWMFSYRYMHMFMENNIRGTKIISNNAVFDEYMVSPQKMNMSMHMLGFMFAPTNDVTLMLMGNYKVNQMELMSRMSMSRMDMPMMDVHFDTQSKGFGDFNISALIRLKKWRKTNLHGQIGTHIPIGSIDQKDFTAMSAENKVLLGYPMQLGTGSWDPFIGLTYSGKNEKWSWGMQSKFTLRFTNNKADYRLGNLWNNQIWFAKPISNNISLSFDLMSKHQGKIKGKHKNLNTMMMPLFNNLNSGYDQLWTGLGLNYIIHKGNLKGLRIALSGQIPIAQHVHGIQMQQQWQSTIGLQYAL